MDQLDLLFNQSPPRNAFLEPFLKITLLLG